MISNCTKHSNKVMQTVKYIFIPGKLIIKIIIIIIIIIILGERSEAQGGDIGNFTEGNFTEGIDVGFPRWQGT